MTARYLSARRVARDLSMPWAEIEPLLEARGADILRINKRVRVAAVDVERFIADSRRPPLAVARDRADLVLELALERMGARKRQGARRTSEVSQ